MDVDTSNNESYLLGLASARRTSTISGNETVRIKSHRSMKSCVVGVDPCVAGGAEWCVYF